MLETLSIFTILALKNIC